MAASRINSIERSHSNGRSNGHQQSSEEVYQEISRIRDDMDHTLDEIGDYLHPKHLLDYVVDAIRSGSPGSSKETVREYANQGLSALKRHPGPALLAGGAVLWYLMDQNRGEDELNVRRTRRVMPLSATYGAWEEGYDWSTAPEDEQTWSQKAKQALDQVRTVVADKTMAAKDKVKHVAKHMVGVSGKTREQLHAQWANLRPHSGSFVDARTGEPYDDSYGDTAWSQAEACACLCDENADDSSWSGKAQDTVNSMSESLKNTGASVKEQFRSLGGHLSGLASSGKSRMGNMMSAGRERAGRMASGAGESMSRGWESASSGLHSAADSARHGMSRVGSSVSQGVRQGSDQFRRTIQEQPLAVGAACLGLGLLAGLLAPMTRRENELMGETSDQLKDQVKDKAREVGQEAVERGKHVAAAATTAVKKEADRQGLTAENLAQTAKQGAGSGDMASQLSASKKESGPSGQGASCRNT
ncbi:MAG TPA: DUF3618 domain-containing protein [Lacipirellula sp.]